MRAGVSDTATYGDLTRGKRVITEETREEMWQMLREVQDGIFAKEWILEKQTGRPNTAASPFSPAAASTAALMRRRTMAVSSSI